MIVSNLSYIVQNLSLCSACSDCVQTSNCNYVSCNRATVSNLSLWLATIVIVGKGELDKGDNAKKAQLERRDKV